MSAPTVSSFWHRPSALRLRFDTSTATARSAALCGNATLCAARLAARARHRRRAIRSSRSRTDSGDVTARFRDGLPEIDLQPVTDVQDCFEAELETERSRTWLCIGRRPASRRPLHGRGPVAGRRSGQTTAAPRETGPWCERELRVSNPPRAGESGPTSEASKPRLWRAGRARSLRRCYWRPGERPATRSSSRRNLAARSAFDIVRTAIATEHRSPARHGSSLWRNLAEIFSSRS